MWFLPAALGLRPYNGLGISASQNNGDDQKRKERQVRTEVSAHGEVAAMALPR